MDISDWFEAVLAVTIVLLLIACFMTLVGGDL